MTAAVADALVPQRLAVDDVGAFAATVTALDLGGLRVVGTSGSALRSVRSRAAQPDGTAFALLGLGERGWIEHGAARHPIDPDHLVLIPGAAAFEVVYPRSMDVVLVVRPAAAGPIPLPEDGPVRGLALSSAGRAVLGGSLRAVLGAAAAAEAADLADLAAVVDGALSVALRPLVGEFAHDPVAALRTAALRLVDRHLDEPELGPRWLAARLHVSLSSLHRAFRDSGEGVAAAVRARRLDRVAALLADPAVRGATVGELAAHYGFSSASHLAGSFRARFGATPGEHRRRHASAPTVTSSWSPPPRPSP
jgi:AraC-like DNA-binding protein